jgi:hypothetical protein
MVIKIGLFKTLISIQFDLLICCELLLYLIQFDFCHAQFVFRASVHQFVAANLFDWIRLISCYQHMEWLKQSQTIH